MVFHSITDKTFTEGQLVLIKTNYQAIPYYVCTVRFDDTNKKWFFEEAAGEQYDRYWETQVIGWMPIEQLDCISVMDK